jgi:hypothetical protein
MVVLPLFPYLFLLFFFSIFLASAAPSLLLQFLFFTSLVWSSLPYLSFSVFLCLCILSSSVSLISLFFFLFVSVSLFFLVCFVLFLPSFSRFESLSFLNSHNPSLFRLFSFLFFPFSVPIYFLLISFFFLPSLSPSLSHGIYKWKTGERGLLPLSSHGIVVGWPRGH